MDFFFFFSSGMSWLGLLKFFGVFVIFAFAVLCQNSIAVFFGVLPVVAKARALVQPISLPALLLGRIVTRAFSAFSLSWVLGCILWALCVLAHEGKSGWPCRAVRVGEGGLGDLSTQVVPCNLLFTQCNSLCSTNNSFGYSG